jgi:hypothetical protein
VKTISPLVALSLAATLAGCTTASPVPAGDVVATVYKVGSALYVEPLPPQSLACIKPLGQPGCRVSAVDYSFANVTPQQQADAEWFYTGPDLDRNVVLVVGHLATLNWGYHRTVTTGQQTWFMVDKLYMAHAPWHVIERHSTQFFHATGTTSNAQVVAISRGEQSPRAAQITWTGWATHPSGGLSRFEDIFVTGQADFTRSPLPVNADEYFVRYRRISPGAGRLPPFDRVRSPY